MNDDTDSRAALHRALGDPHRLAAAEALLLTDRAPSELEALLGLPSNLLAHHLAALESVGLVERVRSSGDARRRYLRLRTEYAYLVGAPPARTVERVVFVCTGNSARSPLAEALWNASSDVPATSAGTHPAAATHPGALAAAALAGLTVTLTPRAVSAVGDGELVVTVCDEAHEEWGRTVPSLHWSLPDPVASTSPTAFDDTVDVLRERVRSLARCVRLANEETIR